MAKTTTSTHRCLVRVAAAAREKVLASSGTKGIFWTPEIDKRDLYAILWLPHQEAEDYREALRAAQGNTTLGIVTRVDQQGARRFGLRVLAKDRDTVATKLGRPVGMRFFIRNTPIEWIEQDVQDLAKQLGWTITIPNPQTAVRIRKGVASWAVRASAMPGVRSAVVMSGDERLTVQIVPAEDKPSQPRQASAPPPRSWAAVVSTNNIKTPKITNGDEMAKKRKAETQLRPKSEPPVPAPAGARTKHVTFENKPEDKVTKETDTMQTMFATLIAQMKDMQQHITGLGSRMTCLEDMVQATMHGDDQEDQNQD